VTKYLQLVKVGKTYPAPDGGHSVVVEDFDLALAPGEFVTLIGHSGCGKSTVLSMIAGLNPLTAGSVVLDGKPVTGPGPDRGVVFQAPCLLPWMTAFANVMLGVDQAHARRPRKERKELAAHYLTLVGLADAMHKRPAELSGGMRQRVGIARAFALDPKMLLLDEPFGALDPGIRADIHVLMKRLWNETDLTVVMVTHDMREAFTLATRVVAFERPRDRPEERERYGASLSTDTPIWPPRKAGGIDPDRPDWDDPAAPAGLSRDDPAPVLEGALA
jgi:NitT/TauT family transport system ATP-binding protein